MGVLCTSSDSGDENAGFPSRCPGRERIACEMRVVEMQNQRGITLNQEDLGIM